MDQVRDKMACLPVRFRWPSHRLLSEFPYLLYHNDNVLHIIRTIHCQECVTILTFWVHSLSCVKAGLRSVFGLLCPDGSVRDLEQSCPWASRPWDAWLTRTGHESVSTRLCNLLPRLIACICYISNSLVFENRIILLLKIF